MRLISLAILFALTVAPLLAQKDKDKGTVTDDVLVDQVHVRLAEDSEIGGQPIDVDAHNGVVVLKGKVSNEKFKLKAERIAKKVKGVTGVENKILVSPN
jgi:osmotically-inducible protein OsmY